MKFSHKLMFNIAQTALGLVLLTMVGEEYIWYAVPTIILLNFLNYVEGCESILQRIKNDFV